MSHGDGSSTRLENRRLKEVKKSVTGAVILLAVANLFCQWRVVDGFGFPYDDKITMVNEVWCVTWFSSSPDIPKE
jgi:hypothetical protein